MNFQKTREVRVGNITIGGGAPISVQTMTNADPHDGAALRKQLSRIADAGADIVRLTVPDMRAVSVFAEMKEAFPRLPLTADIHFDYRLAIESCAAGADKIRINPGNIGDKTKVKLVADACRARGVPIRIGVNGGSLEKELLAKYGAPTAEALVESGINQARLLESFGFNDIMLSLKSSSPAVTVRANLLAAELCDYPLHLGVTETGGLRMGRVKSAIGIGGLLAAGIGDTIRVSLTGDPTEEIAAGREILQALGISGKINIVSCPTCGRCKIPLIETVAQLEERFDAIALPDGMKLTVAVMGCAVNGPGEAREADFGAAGGDDEWLLFEKGAPTRKIPAQAATDILTHMARDAVKRFEQKRI